MATMQDQWDSIGERLISIAEHGKISMADMVKMVFYAGGAGALDCISQAGYQKLTPKEAHAVLTALFNEMDVVADDIITRNPDAPPEKDEN